MEIPTKIKNPQGFMNLEDCTRFFILTTSPAHEGLLVLEQIRYSGFWGSATLELTYCPRLPISFREANFVKRKVKQFLLRLTLYASSLTKKNSGIAGLVPSYSGGTARELHPLPFICSVSVGSDNRKDCVTLSSKSFQPPKSSAPTMRTPPPLIQG
jgi:hypothetical protein